eukprot:gnl/MRDRNA2_/MRDRNA2_57217_c0_seq1.p1 gnl/MRDRNA2_/MRDRNA2_57217_c0~~gnl/MRDRNA2_/MRDRNA2_57217_c0_seq1.p1  ORF type:complete len:874 (+),score=136.50 gnl/MRDRNA2_/MRDRNA2_57217_c0_seq1:102-2624(+)
METSGTAHATQVGAVPDGVLDLSRLHLDVQADDGLPEDFDPTICDDKLDTALTHYHSQYSFSNKKGSQVSQDSRVKSSTSNLSFGCSPDCCNQTQGVDLPNLHVLTDNEVPAPGSKGAPVPALSLNVLVNPSPTVNLQHAPVTLEGKCFQGQVLNEEHVSQVKKLQRAVRARNQRIAQAAKNVLQEESAVKVIIRLDDKKSRKELANHFEDRSRTVQIGQDSLLETKERVMQFMIPWNKSAEGVDRVTLPNSTMELEITWRWVKWSCGPAGKFHGGPIGRIQLTYTCARQGEKEYTKPGTAPRRIAVVVGRNLVWKPLLGQSRWFDWFGSGPESGGPVAAFKLMMHRQEKAAKHLGFAHFRLPKPFMMKSNGFLEMPIELDPETLLDQDPNTSPVGTLHARWDWAVFSKNNQMSRPCGVLSFSDLRIQYRDDYTSSKLSKLQQSKSKLDGDSELQKAKTSIEGQKDTSKDIDRRTSGFLPSNMQEQQPCLLIHIETGPRCSVLENADGHDLDEWESSTGTTDVADQNTLTFPDAVARFTIDWRIHAQDDMDHYAEDFYKPHAKPADLVALAKKVSYMTMSAPKLLRTVLRRENPAAKMLPYNPLIPRHQRYSILCTGMMMGLFWCCLFFRADCLQVPKPVACKKKKKPWWSKFLSWDVLFGSIWGIILTTPHPLILITMFKKRVILKKMDDAQKAYQIKIWRRKEKVGWFVVIISHVWCVFFCSQFVRYYPWILVEKWVNAVLMSVVHRFGSAPLVRGGWMSILLIFSRWTWLCDCCLLMSPATLAFAGPPGLLAAPKKKRTAKHLWGVVRALYLSGTLKMAAQRVESGAGDYNDVGDLF